MFAKWWPFCSGQYDKHTANEIKCLDFRPLLYLIMQMRLNRARHSPGRDECVKHTSVLERSSFELTIATLSTTSEPEPVPTHIVEIRQKYHTISVVFIVLTSDTENSSPLTTWNTSTVSGYTCWKEGNIFQSILSIYLLFFYYNIITMHIFKVQFFVQSISLSKKNDLDRAYFLCSVIDFYLEFSAYLFLFGDCENIWTSYYHQMGNMNHQPLFRVRTCYILTFSISAVEMISDGSNNFNSMTEPEVYISKVIIHPNLIHWSLGDDDVILN